jgi:uncharacterized membrane protein
MASCAKCGSVVSAGASFCNVCGSPVSAGSVPAPLPPTPAPAPGVTTVGMTSNVAGALCYLVGWITGIIFLVLEPYKRDPFVRFHAFQSIIFSVALMIFSFIWSNLFLGALTLGFMFSILSLIASLVYLGCFLFWLFLMYKAYNNESFKIPVIGDWAAKQAAK